AGPNDRAQSRFRAAAGLSMAGFSEAVAREVHGLLDISVGDVLVGAWNKARELREALEKTRDKADETVLVPLLDHTVKSDHHPYVDILQNDVPIARIEFTVHVELEVEGVLLKVRGGHIDGILSGRVKARGTVKLGEFVLVEKKLQPVIIPGSWSAGRAA